MMKGDRRPGRDGLNWVNENGRGDSDSRIPIKRKFRSTLTKQRSHITYYCKYTVTPRVTFGTAEIPK
ncbi:hypothetical protein XENTR_v10006846 [Xenopus tropicalis]|nr:hypothetical protein XENTR_v10006846 [Xenopus tropicalis]